MGLGKTDSGPGNVLIHNLCEELIRQSWPKVTIDICKRVKQRVKHLMPAATECTLLVLDTAQAFLRESQW